MGDITRSGEAKVNAAKEEPESKLTTAAKSGPNSLAVIFIVAVTLMTIGGLVIIAKVIKAKRKMYESLNSERIETTYDSI